MRQILPRNPVSGHAGASHHAGLAGAELGNRAGQERPAAPDIHHGAQNWGDPPHPSGIGELVAQEVGEHVVEAHHWHRQNQHDPEQPPELPDVVAVACMTAVVLVPGVVLAGLTVIAMVAGVLVTVCWVMIWTAVMERRVMMVVTAAIGVLVAVIRGARVRVGMVSVLLRCG
ncbi:hypothetical protein [Microbacterium aurum]